MAFHPDIPSGISGPWVEIYNPEDVSLFPKREHLETLLKQRTKLWIIHFVISKKNAVAYTTHSKAHDNFLSDLVVIHP